MAQFKSKHAFLTIHFGEKKVDFFQGIANVDDEELIKLLEEKPGIERIDKPEVKKEESKEETKEENPEKKMTKKTKAKAKK